MNSPHERTVRAYDATAERYHARWHQTDPLVEVKETIAGRIQPGALVLDAGCGTGRDLEWFQHHGFSVIGLDASFGMLATCSPGLPLVQADMRSIPLRDASVDAWWASASLLHLRPWEVEVVLRELRRITRPGGAGFVSLKEGRGEGFESVDDGPHERFFRYWEGPELDGHLARCNWTIEQGWASADTLGRASWLCRLVTRA